MEIDLTEEEKEILNTFLINFALEYDETETNCSNYLQMGGSNSKYELIEFEFQCILFFHKKNISIKVKKIFE